MIAVGVDAQRVVHVEHPVEASLARQAQRLADLLDHRLQAQQLAARRRFLGAAEAQRVVAEVDGAVERGDELGRKALHGRIGDGRQAIRQELRIGQHAAQVVVDLAHREAELRQPRLLQQRAGKLPLHLAQLALGDADLVVAAGRAR